MPNIVHAKYNAFTVFAILKPFNGGVTFDWLINWLIDWLIDWLIMEVGGLIWTYTTTDSRLKWLSVAYESHGLSDDTLNVLIKVWYQTWHSL